MSNDFEVSALREGLDELGNSFEAVDMENVKTHTLKRAAHAMAEMVRTAISDEDNIISPALNGPNERGPGPSMVTRDAWKVEKVGNRYTVRPHPKVEQRAVVLNYGYPGEITPNRAEALKFEINGVPIFADSVEGPEYTGYWQAAMRRFVASDKLERIASAELRKEFEENV